jgi:hypothetical protein
MNNMNTWPLIVRVKKHFFLLCTLMVCCLVGQVKAANQWKPCFFRNRSGEFFEPKHCIQLKAQQPFSIAPKVLLKLFFENNLAVLHHAKTGWLYVNHQGIVIIFGVPTFDNGPDWFHEGRVRYERAGQCGYANQKGQLVIPAQYDGCWNFEGGVARVCRGCSLAPKDSEGRSGYGGGTWFCLNRFGKKVTCAL